MNNEVIDLNNTKTLSTEEFYSDVLINSGKIDISINEEETVDIDNLNLNNTPGNGISTAIVEGVSKYMEASMLTLVSTGISNLLLMMGINEVTMNIAKQACTIMDNSITLVSSIITSTPSNIYMVPSGTSTTNILCTSLKDMFDSMWLSLEQQYFTEINNFITNLPSLMEVQKDLIEALINQAETLIGTYCYKYTGYTLKELIWMCKHYNAMYKQYMELIRQMRSDGIDVTGNVSVEINPQNIKQLLLDELLDCSDLIYNAFIIVLIKDAITLIKELVKLFTDADLSTLSDGINSFGDVMELLEEIGLGDDKSTTIISLQDMMMSNINKLQSNVQLLVGNIGAQTLQSGINIMDSISNNIDININYNITLMYNFKADTDNGLIIMYIYSDPTTSKFKNMLTKSLSEKNELCLQFMNNTDILLMINTLSKCYNDETLEKYVIINNTKYVFEFDIKEKQSEEKQKEQEYNINTDVSYSLGIVTEDYTYDPLAKKKRPTIQLVHELFVILKLFFPILNVIVKLISNYKINKEKVKNHAQGNLWGVAKLIAKAKGLIKKVNVNNTNFYTVRTLKFYNYIKDNISNFNNSNLINIDNLQTEIIYIWLKSNNENFESLDINLPTMLYIDYDLINSERKLMEDEIDNLNKYFDDSSLFVKYPESKYKNGDLLGLDKIEYIGDEIYYSDSSLPVYGSLILRAYGKS